MTEEPMENIGQLGELGVFVGIETQKHKELPEGPTGNIGPCGGPPIYLLGPGPDPIGSPGVVGPPGEPEKTL